MCVLSANGAEIGELPKEARKGLKILPVETIDGVLAMVFGKVK